MAVHKGTRAVVDGSACPLVHAPAYTKGTIPTSESARVPFPDAGGVRRANRGEPPRDWRVSAHRPAPPAQLPFAGGEQRGRDKPGPSSAAPTWPISATDPRPLGRLRRTRLHHTPTGRHGPHLAAGRRPRRRERVPPRRARGGVDAGRA